MTDMRETFEKSLFKVPSLGIVMRVGEANPAMAALASEHGPGAFLSPMNPLKPSTADNSLESLKRDLEGYVFFNGSGESPDGSWTESSLLIFGLPPNAAISLALRYGQQAFVWICRDGIPTLVFT